MSEADDMMKQIHKINNINKLTKQYEEQQKRNKGTNSLAEGPLIQRFFLSILAYLPITSQPKSIK